MPDVDGGKTARIILYGIGALEMSSAYFIEYAILGLCEHLGMTAMAEPVTQEIPPGLSCVLIIAESHIAMHTWPETDSIRVVIDCCVDYDHNAAAEWLKSTFEAERYAYCIC